MPAGYLPGDLDEIAGYLGLLAAFLAPWLFTETGDVETRADPGRHAGQPARQHQSVVGEHATGRPRRAHKKLIDVVLKLKSDLKSLPENPTDAQAAEVFMKHVPDLLSVSKCPDFIVNKGHYFGSNLSDDDKNALIEFLKTF